MKTCYANSSLRGALSREGGAQQVIAVEVRDPHLKLGKEKEPQHFPCALKKNFVLSNSNCTYGYATS